MRKFTFFVILLVFGCWFNVASAQNVRVPDANLAAALREALDLAPTENITKQALQGLTRLDAQSREISDLSGLEHASQLQRIFLSDNQIEDITPLKDLTQLTVLGIWDNQISNISPLVNMTRLRSLSIWDNQIQDITPLKNLTQLNWLDLGINQISDITPLANLTRLEVLLIWDNQINNITPLRNLTRLEELDFSNNRVEDIRPIARLTRLEILYFAENQVRNITPLANLTRLEKLRISNNRIQDVTPLASLKLLTELQLAGNLIVDFSPLRPLVAENPTLMLDVDISQPMVVTKTGVPTLYWVSSARGTLHRLVGTRVENLAPHIADVTSLTVDVGGGRLYWTQGTGTGRHAGKIQSTNLDGTDVQLIKEASPFYGITLNTEKSKLYLTNKWGRIQTINFDGSKFHWNLITDLASPRDIAVDVVGRKIYWTDADGSIRYANFNGTDIQTLATGGTPGSIAIAGGKVYWTEKNSDSTGQIRRANLDGTNPEELLTLMGVPHGIAVDTASGKVYWTDTNGRIQRANLNGTEVQDIVTNLVSPGDLAIGGAALASLKPDGADFAADVNQDGRVNITDLKLVAIAIIAAESPPANPLTDIDGNGTVDVTDLVLVIAALDETEAAAAPTFTAELSTQDRDKIQTQIDLLIASNDDSLAARRTLVFLQSLLVAPRPTKTQLLANYPNPFNPETWIPYHLAKASDVQITIYDMRGTVVRRLEVGHQRAGIYTSRSRAAYWDGKNDVGEKVASGLYCYQLQADNMSLLRKMVILK